MKEKDKTPSSGQLIDCSRCKGSGKTNGDDCIKCKGTGKVNLLLD